MNDNHPTALIRSTRVGSAMGRVAGGHPDDPVDTVFFRAAELAVTRRLVPNRANRTHLFAFADAFLVAWLRARGRKAEASYRRRALREARTHFGTGGEYRIPAQNRTRVLKQLIERPVPLDTALEDAAPQRRAETA